MEIALWLETLLLSLLSKTSLPGWLVTFITEAIKRYVTAEVLQQLEDQVICFVCAKVELLAGPTPSPEMASLIAALESLLGCSKCGPHKAVAPAGAAAV